MPSTLLPAGPAARGARLLLASAGRPGPFLARNASDTKAKPARPHGGTLLQLTSKEIDADVAAIRQRDRLIAADLEDMPWGRSAYVAGPRGVMVEIYQP